MVNPTNELPPPGEGDYLCTDEYDSIRDQAALARSRLRPTEVATAEEAHARIRSDMAAMGFREEHPGSFSRVSFFRSTSTATDAHSSGSEIVIPPPQQTGVWRNFDPVWHAYLRAAIARRNARNSNLRSLRNMMHWRRRVGAWRYQR